MTLPENKYYLYRHIRLDTNEPFYIGIGTKFSKRPKSFKSEYQRAHSFQRNDLWFKITNKSKYDIEILFESNNRNVIIEKEKEFIKLYGRIDLETGTLANHTDGGDYNEGAIKSRKTIEKWTKTMNSLHKEGKIKMKSKVIYQYSLTGEF